MDIIDEIDPAIISGEPGRDYLPVGPYVNKSYLDYSVSVLLSRAIPDVRDGLKPVHRRILYAMHNLGLGGRTTHKKSARVVGDVIGKYHPHGDASVYDAMVLMAQGFNLRHPLIDGQGNWGSIDGDGAAAMRYTECRLAEYGRLFLEEINQGTVDFRPNYDGNDLEPACLPARVPAVLLNDQIGIAVGMASDVPAHNLEEVVKASVALFKNPNTTLKGLLRSIKGPDFPCGGQVINSREELEEVYTSGRGMLTVRARYEVKQDADGWHLVFTELPPRVSPEQILLEIDAISNPQPKTRGAKAKRGAENISAEQRAAKLSILNRISEVQNGAGKDTGDVYLEIYPKSRRQKPEDLATYLFGVTNLETKVKVNINLLNLQRLPVQMGLLQILQEWNQFRFDTVTRRCRHRLDKVEARLHILEGFERILLDIDEVIRIIRRSDDDQVAKAALMQRWELSDIQAEKILEIKLRQLTRLDELAIRKEHEKLAAEQRDLQRVLGDRDAMVELIIGELKADAAKYGTPRRTVIEEAEAAQFDESALLDEPVTLILSRKGWIRSRSGHAVDPTTQSFKDGDELQVSLETRSTHSVILLDENGRAYTLSAGQVPGGRGDGVPITSLIELQERARIAAMFPVREGEKVLLASTVGYGFVTEVGNLMGRNKAGKAVLNTAGGTALPPILLAQGQPRIAAVNSSGYMLVFGLDEVGEYPKGKGNKLIALRRGETLAHLVAIDQEVRLPSKRGKRDVVVNGEELDGYVRKRGGRGKLVRKQLSFA